MRGVLLHCTNRVQDIGMKGLKMSLTTHDRYNTEIKFTIAKHQARRKKMTETATEGLYYDQVY